MVGVKVTTEGLTGLSRGFESELAADTIKAMNGATVSLKTVLRGQVTSAGLGTRLANTWQGKVYENNGINAAGFVYSKAPDIIDSFSRGATISPLGGKHYLWIPSKNVPRAAATGRASSTKKMKPAEVLTSLGLTEFVIRKGRAGHLLAFIVQARGVTKRGAIRKVRKGRLAQGTSGQLLLMFTLVPTVTLPKELDLQGAADDAAGDFVARLEQS